MLVANTECLLLPILAQLAPAVPPFQDAPDNERSLQFLLTIPNRQIPGQIPIPHREE